MTDGWSLAIVAATFLLAGMVKGVIGLGLPTIALALLTAAFGLIQAMALLLVPSFVTNLWQGVVGGQFLILLRRLWPFLLLATATVWLGALALSRVDLAWLSALLGVLIMLYGGIGLAGLRLRIDPSQERWLAPFMGAVNGVLTGMTGSFVVPGVIYLQAIGLPRDQLIQAMGMLFTAATVALGLALAGNRLLTADLGLVSLAAVLPALVGMVLGQRIRRQLPEQTFRRVFFAALLALGGYIVVRSLV